MEDGVFPSYMTITADDPLEIEEERRLAYVGITRAKDELTLTCAKQRMIRGETQYNPVSRFVREIPPLLMDSAPAPAKRKVSFSAEESYAEDSHERSFLRAKPFSPGESVSARPRAVVRPKRTAAENQPFIMKTIAAAPLSAKKMTGEASEPLPAGKLAYGVGDRVRHARYGEGTVLKIEPGPRDSQVTVVFDEMGQKIMYAGFAKLQKL